MTDHIKSILILGAGESGTGAALLAKAKGFQVFLSDKAEIKEVYKNKLKAGKIDFEEKTHQKAVEIIQKSDAKNILVIKSPGIPDNTPLIQSILAKNISIISEIEFGYFYTKARIIAITGSNGKTTTTSLIYHILKSQGMNVGLGGNIGESFAAQVVEDKYDYWVLELSSFQLDHCYTFKPYIAILLNITPDHLDRYEYNFQKYVDAKFRIVQAQDEKDYFIFYKDNPAISKELELREKFVYNSMSASYEKGLYGEKPDLKSIFLPIKAKEADKKPDEKEDFTKIRISGGFATLHESKETISFMVKSNFFDLPYNEIPLKGVHNVINTAASVLACQVLGLKKEAIKAGLGSFKNIAHRLEEITEIRGVLFVNDSKATNIDSVLYALGSFQSEKGDEKNIIWIAGGQDKGNDYFQIREIVSKKVKALVCLGVDNSKLKNNFKDIVSVVTETQDVKDAVKTAFSFAKVNDVVLLSPACASFDLFKNYEDRGNQFREAVLALKKEVAG